MALRSRFQDVCLNCGTTVAYDFGSAALLPHRCPPARNKSRRPSTAHSRPATVPEGRCPYCRERFTEQNPPTQDHIIPVSKGGTRAAANLLTVCQTCNNARGNAPWDEYVLAVIEAWSIAVEFRDGYRRPKWRQMPGGTFAMTHRPPADPEEDA